MIMLQVTALLYKKSLKISANAKFGVDNFAVP